MSDVERWEELDEITTLVENDLTDNGDIPTRLLRMNHIHVCLPTDGVVFDYPDVVYFEIGENLVPYADEIESAIETYVSVERSEITHRTDGHADTTRFIPTE